MSKKSRRKMRRARREEVVQGPKPRWMTRRAALLIACCTFALVAAGGALSRRGGYGRIAALTSGFLQATPTPTPLTLSKEYVYAGGRLVATEEPAADRCLRKTGCRYHILNSTPPSGLVATAQPNASNPPQVLITWGVPTGIAVDHYEVERSQSASGPFTPLSPTTASTSFTDATATPGVAYLYRVSGYDADGGYTDYSNTDLATTVVFTDDPLTPRVTVIQARQLVELRQAVTAVRTLAGLAPPAWTYPDPVSDPPSQRRLIYLEDVTDLRTNLDAALNVLGLYQAYPADPTLARGAVVTAEHFNQIRNRVR